jgi:hypothetical protein
MTTQDNAAVADPSVPLRRPQWRVTDVRVDVNVAAPAAKPSLCEAMPLGGR